VDLRKTKHDPGVYDTQRHALFSACPSLCVCLVPWWSPCPVCGAGGGTCMGPWNIPTSEATKSLYVCRMLTWHPRCSGSSIADPTSAAQLSCSHRTV
jgi:hypothetical protein